MDGQKARQLATDWIRAHRDPQAQTDSYSWFAGEIAGLLSDDASVGTALIDDAPAVIAVEGRRFIWLTVVDCDEGRVTTRFSSFPVEHLGIDMKSVIEPRDPASLIRERSWTLISPVAETVTVVTEDWLQAPWTADKGPKPGERVMREVAKQVGHPLPDSVVRGDEF